MRTIVVNPAKTDLLGAAGVRIVVHTTAFFVLDQEGHEISVHMFPDGAQWIDVYEFENLADEAKRLRTFVARSTTRNYAPDVVCIQIARTKLCVLLGFLYDLRSERPINVQADHKGIVTCMPAI